MNYGDIVEITDAGKDAFDGEHGIRPAGKGVVLEARKHTCMVRPLELFFADDFRISEVVFYCTSTQAQIDGLI